MGFNFSEDIYNRRPSFFFRRFNVIITEQRFDQYNTNKRSFKTAALGLIGSSVRLEVKLVMQ